jgi:hypothetical protein
MELIKQLINRNSQSPPNEAIHQLAKAAESTMHKVLLLDQEVKELHTEKERRKRKCTAPRSYIASRGVLTGAEGQQLAQEAIEKSELREPTQKKHAPPRCTRCHIVGHTRTSCPSK